MYMKIFPSYHRNPSPKTTRCTHPPCPCIDSTFYPPSPRSPFIPLSTSSYNCLPPSSSTPQINNTVENVHPPPYTLCHPLEPTLYHPNPPTHLFPLSYTNYPLPAESRFTPSPPPQSVHLDVPSPRSSADLQLIQRCRRRAGVVKPRLCSSALSFLKCMKA